MSNPKHIVVFNAPPRSGKDEAATYFKEKLEKKGVSCAIHTFKHGLIEVASKFLGVSKEEFLHDYDDCTEAGVWCKDIPQWHVGGKYLSSREVLIHVSENVLKPTFGEGVCGKMFVESWPDAEVILVPDGGFAAEIEEVIDSSDVRLLDIVKIKRTGCTFKGDSRGYLPDLTYSSTGVLPLYLTLENNSTLQDFHTTLDAALTVLFSN